MEKIAVIGYVMLDAYYYGESKFNPESSEKNQIPARLNVRTEYHPGGAGNVAANLSELKCDFLLVGLVGADPMSHVLRERLEKANINHHLILDETRPTIVKQRYFLISTGKNELRWDFEEKHPASEEKTEKILAIVHDYDIILISDYNKGIVTRNLIRSLIESGKKVIADTKPHHMDFFEGAFLVKPNIREAREKTLLENELEAAESLRNILHTRILLTRGEQGMSYFGIPGDEPLRIDIAAYKPRSRTFVDVIGAGDSGISALTAFLAKDYGLKTAILAANTSAGISVTHPGCYPVSEKEIIKAFIEQGLELS
jgi:D-beta-D-heptose 7-phosphate kinase/D-beta-D-heptose 1-phosphate adenosyltransferase